MARRTLILVAALAVLTIGLSACGNKYSISSGNLITVSAITSPFPAGGPVPFTLTGSGFTNQAGTMVTVRFIDEAMGTPFGGSDTVEVVGTIVSDTEITGISPPAPGVSVFAFVEVILPSTASGISTEAIAEFLATPATAVNDNYTATGNVELIVDDINGVLDNDLPPPIISVISFDATSANGGEVAVAADGSFTYNPPPGYQGLDSFDYTISDGFDMSTATVFVNVLEMIWFIDSNAPGGGDGRFTNPFNSVAAFNGTANDMTGDYIFLYQRNVAYSGSFTLLNNQRLLGQGVDLVVNSTTFVTATSSPDLTAAGGTTVALAANNTIRGLDIANTNGGGITGGTVGNLAINTLTINATNGPGIAVTTSGNLAVTLNSVTSTNSASDAIQLDSCTGSFSAGPVDLTSVTGEGIDILNSSATFVFSDVTITTTSGAGMQVAGSGSLTVVGANNTISSNGGAALDVTNTTIGAAGLTFASISANGGTNGIRLDTTGSTGSLTVTGDGASAANASGGTIQNCGTGILFNDTLGPQVEQINVSNTTSHGIDITSVTNASFTFCQVTDAGSADDDHSIKILNLFGDMNLFEDLTITGVNEDGIELVQNMTDDATQDRVTIRRVTISGHTAAGFGEHCIDVQGASACNCRVDVIDCTLTTNVNGSQGLRCTTTDTCTFRCDCTDSDFNAGAAFGSGAFSMTCSSSSNGTCLFQNNFVTTTPLTAVECFCEDTSTFHCQIEDNTVSGTGGNTGFGIHCRQDGNGQMFCLIDENIISTFGADAILVQARDGTTASGTCDATIRDNVNTTVPLIIGAGIRCTADDDNVLCVSITEKMPGVGNDVVGNILPMGAGDIVLENLNNPTSTLNVAQMNAVDLSNLNNGIDVFAVLVTYNVPCTLPTIP